MHSVQVLRAYMALRILHITPVTVFVRAGESESESSDDDSLPSLISHDGIRGGEDGSPDNLPPLVSNDAVGVSMLQTNDNHHDIQPVFIVDSMGNFEEDDR
jgi:hypothetical protein